MPAATGVLDLPEMTLASPRRVVEARSYLHESVLLLHLPRLAMVLAFATMGTFLAPQVDLTRFAALLAALVLGVGLTAYRLDEWKDRTTAPAIPARHHLAVAGVGLVGALAIGVWLVAMLGAGLLLPFALAGVGVVGYNLVPFLHRPTVFALTWGALPVWGGFALQTLTWPPLSVVGAGVVAGALGLAHLWTWGLRRCGRGAVCAKPQNVLRHRAEADAPCHSPAVRCSARLTLPRELNEHAKATMRLHHLMVLGLTAWVVMAHLGL